MEHTHIVTRFDKDLNEIETLLVEMADKVSEQLRQSAKALQDGDTDLAVLVSKNDSVINKLEERIDKKAIRLIALRQPMAEDLRSAITTLKVSTSLERMGDYAKTLSYRTRELGDLSTMKPVLRTISEMSEKVCIMLNLVMEGYVNRDLEKAVKAREADQEINDKTDALFRELLT
ncbi:MAG: phosphate signaling complex protein PhoU, partial [Amylibacter sp.]